MNRRSPGVDMENLGDDLPRLIQSIAALGEESRIVLSLYYLEGLSGAEIAQVLGTSEEVFHVFFADAMTVLRAQGRDTPKRAA